MRTIKPIIVAYPRACTPITPENSPRSLPSRLGRRPQMVRMRRPSLLRMESSSSSTAPPSTARPLATAPSQCTTASQPRRSGISTPRRGAHIPPARLPSLGGNQASLLAPESSHSAAKLQKYQCMLCIPFIKTMSAQPPMSLTLLCFPDGIKNLPHSIQRQLHLDHKLLNSKTVAALHSRARVPIKGRAGRSTTKKRFSE